jgi:hypothetical protein
MRPQSSVTIISHREAILYDQYSIWVGIGVNHGKIYLARSWRFMQHTHGISAILASQKTVRAFVSDEYSA